MFYIRPGAADVYFFLLRHASWDFMYIIVETGGDKPRHYDSSREQSGGDKPRRYDSSREQSGGDEPRHYDSSREQLGGDEPLSLPNSL
jgi:hypothetical protein